MNERMLELNNILNESKKMITEAKYPAMSIYGAVEKMIGNEMVKELKKVKGVKKVETVQTISGGLWMVNFNGYTKSDIEMNGYLVLSSPGGAQKNWLFRLTTEHSIRGTNERTYEFVMHDDISQLLSKIVMKELSLWYENT